MELDCFRIGFRRDVASYYYYFPFFPVFALFDDVSVVGSGLLFVGGTCWRENGGFNDLMACRPKACERK